MRAAGRRDATPDLYYFVGSLAMPGVLPKGTGRSDTVVPGGCTRIGRHRVAMPIVHRRPLALTD